MATMTSRMIEMAADLLSEDGENPEYDRGVAEVLCEYLSLPLNDATPGVLAALRSAWPQLAVADLVDEYRGRGF